MIGQFFDTMIVASTDKDVVIMTHQTLRLEKCWKLFNLSHLKGSFVRGQNNSKYYFSWSLRDDQILPRTKSYKM